MDISSCYRPLVSIITVNYNQADVTCCLLDSLQMISYACVEVFVVDNGSKNEDGDKIEKLYPWVKVLKTGKNLGFAGGNNYALPYIKGDYILFLNNDIEVDPEFLEPLVSAFKRTDIGIVSPKIRFFFHPDIIQYAGSTHLSYLTMRNRHIGFAQKDLGQFDIPGFTHFAHGAAMMVTPKFIDVCGPMYHGFFLYYEELDWCERAKHAGFKIWYEPRSIVYHKESLTTGKQSVLKTYYLNRNRLLFLKRNGKGVVYVAGLLYFLLIAFPKRLLIFVIQRKGNHAKELCRSLMWHLNPKKYEFII